MTCIFELTSYGQRLSPMLEIGNSQARNGLKDKDQCSHHLEEPNN